MVTITFWQKFSRINEVLGFVLMTLWRSERKMKQVHWNGKRQAGNQKYETRALSQLFLVFCRFTCPLQNHFSYKSQKFSQLQRISFGEDICLPYPFYSPGGDNLRIRARTKFKLIWKKRCNWETNDKLGDTNHFLHQYIWDIWNHSR